jgi:hypothetical protein
VISPTVPLPRRGTDGEGLPDPNCTPGAISPKVTEDTLATTICKTGYTKSIRPPASITEAQKRGNAAAYGYTGSLRDVEYDHSCRLDLADVRDFLPPRTSAWDNLLVDQDDPEKRIADLEHQLAEQKRGADTAAKRITLSMGPKWGQPGSSCAFAIVPPGHHTTSGPSTRQARQLRYHSVSASAAG